MSKIKIEGNSGGSGTFTIQAPNSDTDATITFPTATGSLLTSGDIGTNVLAPDGDGSGLTGISAGAILQVQTAFWGGAMSQAFVAGDDLIDDINISITPSSTSSKILINVNWCGETSYAPANMIMYLDRNGTKLGHTDSVGNRAWGISPQQVSYSNENLSTIDSAVFSYVDSPSTTSQVTYTLGVDSGGAGTLYTNRTVSTTDTTYYERGVTTLIAMELA